MPYNKPFGQYTEDEQLEICRTMAARWNDAKGLLKQRARARTAEERTAINGELAGLGALVKPDTDTLLPG